MYRHQAIELARRLQSELGHIDQLLPVPDWAVAAILRAYDNGLSQGKATVPLQFPTPANLRCPHCGSDPPTPADPSARIGTLG